MSKPAFSVLIPAKGQPDLVPDALISILRQTFTDFEVIVSNNGADPQVCDALSHLLSDSRVRYLEQAEVVPMPKHWGVHLNLASSRHVLF
jgi:glycosyltransferase involved in cell wall biosynthesis